MLNAKSHYHFPSSKIMANIKISIVVSDFNRDITANLLNGAQNRIQEHGISLLQVKVVHVPGAVEIPFAAQLLAQTFNYQAIICLGAVIRGDTSHYDYVCKQVSDGCQTVMLKFNVPVIFGVLTTDTDQQAVVRSTGETNVGLSAVDTALHMINLVSDLNRYQTA